MDNSGFTTDLPNGLTVSVQWHRGAYSNRDANGDIVSVEIACWVTDKSEEWMTRRVLPNHVRNDDVIGHVSVADVIKFIDEAQKYSADLVKAHKMILEGAAFRL